MLSYDIFEKLSDNSIYSIDNLRLQFNIKEDKYDYYVSSLQPYVEDTESDFYDCRYYHTTKIFSFEHLYSIKSKFMCSRPTESNSETLFLVLAFEGI